MIGLGTIVNVVVVAIGGTIGTFIRKGLPEKIKNIILQATGLAVIIIGTAGTLQGMFKVIDGGSIEVEYTLIMIFSLIIGGIIGEVLGIENKLDKAGLWLQKKLAKEGSRFAEGFVNASLLFCVGAMAIVGALEDGLNGNPNTLFAKSILDGVISVVFASAQGIGVAFSAVSLLLYQGSITLLAGVVKPFLIAEVINQMSLVGSVLIIAIGINILEIKNIKVGNLLPAIFIPILYYIIKTVVG